MIIDEEAAAVVREVFTLYSQGYGKSAIARLLNERGIPKPTEYKRLHGLRYQQPNAYKKQIDEYAKGIRELYLDKVKGLISERDYLEMSKDFSNDKDHAERALLINQQKLSEIEERIPGTRNVPIEIHWNF